MIQTITLEQLNLYQSLFRGRTDVYARYWEKNGQANYSPAYDVNWTAYDKYKLTGGSFKDFKDKKLIPLTPDIVKKHLIGANAIGVYPILQDNTSYFIAADFDGSSWQQDCKNFIDECKKVGLNTYLERSRSGNGGHAWIFFEAPYPCYKCRQTVLEIIRRTLKLSKFDKEVSFDRLFPNQDNLAKEGFGNLIAIPMQGQAVRLNNTLFLDPETFQPYSDQWAFLHTIHKHTVVELKTAYSDVFDKPTSLVPEAPGNSSVTLILNSKIILNRSGLTPQLIHFLKEKLNFISTDYLMKKRLGKSVYKVQKFFKLLEEDGDNILLPRGFLNQLISFLSDNHITYRLKDQRPQIPEVKFTSNIKILPVQQPIVDKALEADSGVIVAPSGSGKTIIGLEIIAQRKLPALILVHRKQLLDQWIERIQSFLEIPKKDIGQYY